MARVPPKPSGKGTPPEPEQVVGNLDRPEPDESATLNFKPSTAFKREYKIYAAQHDMDMLELLQRSFEFYRSANP